MGCNKQWKASQQASYAMESQKRLSPQRVCFHVHCILFSSHFYFNANLFFSGSSAKTKKWMVTYSNIKLLLWCSSSHAHYLWPLLPPPTSQWDFSQCLLGWNWVILQVLHLQLVQVYVQYCSPYVGEFVVVSTSCCCGFLFVGLASVREQRSRQSIYLGCKSDKAASLLSSYCCSAYSSIFYWVLFASASKNIPSVSVIKIKTCM